MSASTTSSFKGPIAARRCSRAKAAACSRRCRRLGRHARQRRSIGASPRRELRIISVLERRPRDGSADGKQSMAGFPEPVSPPPQEFQNHARPASESGQRWLTHRNPYLRVTSIDERGAPFAEIPTGAQEMKSRRLHCPTFQNRQLTRCRKSLLPARRSSPDAPASD